jgi:catechol 2,3-dioxygenase-like lactoylglutathione lyase family enzyme
MSDATATTTLPAADADADADEGFAFQGINHLALVCRDMARTVDFYTQVLGMSLVKTIAIPGGGQHFFFDCGAGDCLAFFWFPEAPEPAPGVASAAALPGRGPLESAIGSMNHVALHVPAERIEQYRQRLIDRGIDCTVIINHDDSEATVTEELHSGVFIRSVYFFDPDGILLELAAWTRPLTADDVVHAPEGRAR